MCEKNESKDANESLREADPTGPINLKQLLILEHGMQNAGSSTNSICFLPFCYT